MFCKKELFLEISQNLQEITGARVFFYSGRNSACYNHKINILDFDSGTIWVQQEKQSTAWPNFFRKYAVIIEDQKS